jgi:formylglycine-generating enzyme required for sulfatase activity
MTRLVPLLVPAFVALALLACGSGGDATGPEAAGEATPPAPPEVAGPPEADRCREEGPRRASCWLPVPRTTLWVGAQATDPSAPAYDPDARPGEGPPRQVTVAPFWIRRIEATVSEFERCVAEGACRPDDTSTDGFGTWGGPGTGVRRLDPINHLTWHGAGRLCAHLGGRQPTQEEWEAAARGTDGRRWPWGDTPGCGVSRASGQTERGRPVPFTEMQRGPCENDGPRRPELLIGESPVGAVGMAGNLWEWTADAAPAEEGADARYVQRGGSWTSTDPLDLRTTVRVVAAPDQHVVDVGVRCAWGPDGT